jgi:hypothetical protein
VSEKKILHCCVRRENEKEENRLMIVITELTGKLSGNRAG